MSSAMPAARPSDIRRSAIRLAGAAALALGFLGGFAQAQTRAVVAPASQTGGESRSDTVVTVTVDHAKVVRLPEKAQTVIVGNPAIADVAVQRNGVMVVTGKSFGVTNLIALDSSGALLAESSVRVSAATESILTVQRGLERESYSCTPVCQPSAQLGDSKKHFDEVGGQASARNAAAMGAETKK
jgi:Flp pilus assembly secretin CpaC